MNGGSPSSCCRRHSVWEWFSGRTIVFLKSCVEMMRWPFVACILRAWVSVRFQEIFHDSESRYLRCPIKFRCPPALGGLINMTKECHIGKFMEQQALRCRYFAGGCKVADGQDNIYDAVWLVFHRPIVVGKETAREAKGAKERAKRDERPALGQFHCR